MSTRRKPANKRKASGRGEIVAALLLFVVAVGLVSLVKITLYPLFTSIQSLLSDFGYAWLPFDMVLSISSWAAMWYRWRDSDSLVVHVGEEVVRKLDYVVIQRLRNVEREQHEMHEYIHALDSGQQIAQEKLDEIMQSQARAYQLLEKLMVEKVPSEYKEPGRTDDLLYFLFTARLNILRFRVARLKEKGQPLRTWIDFARLDWLEEQTEGGGADSLEILLAYDRMLVALFQLYDNEEDAIKKITAEISRLLSDPRQSYIQIHKCDNCANGYVAKYKDNTPGFKETEYYWCRYCRENSKVGDLVLYDSESYEAQKGSIPKEYLEHMEWLGDEEKAQYFDENVWMRSSAFVSPGVMIIERDPQEMVDRAQEFLLLPLNVGDLSEVDWNDYVPDHRQYLATEDGMNDVRRRVETGVFGFCKKCGVPLLPYCPEYKLYRDSLYGLCPCCKTKKELYPPVDGVVYGDVFATERVRTLPWVKALTEKCPKDGTPGKGTAGEEPKEKS